MKSCHFAPVPNMRGRLTMLFTDIEVFDGRPKALNAIMEREVRDALARINARKDEDIDDWAERLGRQFAALGECPL